MRPGRVKAICPSGGIKQHNEAIQIATDTAQLIHDNIYLQKKMDGIQLRNYSRGGGYSHFFFIRRLGSII